MLGSPSPTFWAKRCRRWVADIGSLQVRAYQADLSHVTQIESLGGQGVDEFGGVDILVNNAGICPRLAFVDSTEEDWERLVNVNAKSQYFLMQSVRPHMKARGGGRIVNMASSAGRGGAAANASIYSGTKGVIVMFSKSIAPEVADDGIVVNRVAPGCVDTELVTSLPSEQVEALCAQIPLKRLPSRAKWRRSWPSCLR